MSKKKPHFWFSPRRAHWLTFCCYCGLVVLKNYVSQKAMSEPCRASHMYED